jgi:hypothetical protein
MIDKPHSLFIVMSRICRNLIILDHAWNSCNFLDNMESSTLNPAIPQAQSS